MLRRAAPLRIERMTALQKPAAPPTLKPMKEPSTVVPLKPLLSALVWVTARSERDGQHTRHGRDATEKGANETLQLKQLHSDNRHRVPNCGPKII